MGFLHPSINLKNINLINQIETGKSKNKSNQSPEAFQNYENIICIDVDCRVDKDTLQYRGKLQTNKQQKSKGPEHHLNFTKEIDTESRYFNYRVISSITATGVVLAEDVVAVLEQFNSVNTVKESLLTNTSTNTGCEAGIITLN